MSIPLPRHVRLLPLSAAIAMLVACATTPEPPLPIVVRQPPAPARPPAADRVAVVDASANAPAAPLIHRGSGVMVKGQQPDGTVPATPPVAAGGGSVVLNFEGADIREVVRNILGDILNESYTIDPTVGGQVTIRTTSGIAREALPSTLETLLRMNGATMVRENGIYKILPQAAAVRGNLTPQLGSSQRALPPGFSVQIVPLKFVGAREMVRLLEPFAKEATAVRPDETRNLVILSGTERELKHLLDAIDMFDIDWMRNMSAGIFVLKNSDVKTVATEIDRIIGPAAQSPIAGLLRIVPIERMNALLVITPQPAYIDQARSWIEKLDQGGEGGGQRFFVYNMQNQRAEKIGPLLQQAFTGRASAATTQAPPTVAPGTPAGQIVSPPTFQPQPINQPNTPQPPPQPAQTAAATAAQTAAALAARGAVGADGVVRNLQVVADKDNNTILIVATQAEYAIIESALRKLDVPSRQVLIDVTIAEVKLNNDFTLGVEWYFRNGPRQAGGNFNAGTRPGNPLSGDIASVGGLAAGAPGFNYLLAGGFPGGVQVALKALETSGNTRIIANPHVAALDNQKATIKVGDRIPINQQTVVNGTSNAITTTAQYIDTGVLLTVTPHINAGGLVNLDVSAEVSNPGPAAAGVAPPIGTRSVQTMLNVPSGQTMVMGGLISDSKIQSNSGLPILSRIPVLGGLFGSQELNTIRTELVLFITPRLADNEVDMKNVLDDLRRRMHRLDELFPLQNAADAPQSR